jgi:hypothetical protein
LLQSLPEKAECRKWVFTGIIIKYRKAESFSENIRPG